MAHFHVGRQWPAGGPMFRSTAAAILLAAAQPCLAFGDVGFLPPCSAFTTCTAAVSSSGAYNVRDTVSNVTGGYIMPQGLNEGVTVQQDVQSTGSTSPLIVANFPLNLPPVAAEAFFIGASARAQTDFGLNRAGSLAQIAHKLAAARINIEYVYFATSPNAQKGLLILRASDPRKALKVLNS